MGEKSRMKFMILIALILAAAIIYSFSINQFQDTPGVGLANPEPSQSAGPGDQDLPDSTVLVEVAPDTVQNVIRTLNRYTSYRRTVTAEYLRDGEVLGTLTAAVAVDSGWTRSDVTGPDGRTEHSIVGGGTRWLWYDESREYVELPADEETADLVQRLPTYEDVLALNRRDITAAAYEDRGGLPCVYVEVYQKELRYKERFWISVESGLLVASETVKNGDTVYRMSSYGVESPLTDTQNTDDEAASSGPQSPPPGGGDVLSAKDCFTLPDGTVLHRVAV